MEQVTEQMLNVVFQKYYETFLTHVRTHHTQYTGCMEDITSALTEISTLIQERNQLVNKGKRKIFMFVCFYICFFFV